MDDMGIEMAELNKKIQALTLEIREKGGSVEELSLHIEAQKEVALEQEEKISALDVSVGCECGM